MKRSFSPRSLPARSSPLAARCFCRWKIRSSGRFFSRSAFSSSARAGCICSPARSATCSITIWPTPKTLPVIWLGNLAGTSLIALAEKCTRLVSLSARAQGICELKLSEPLFGAFILAVFCNVMIYIGVESYRSNPHELGKYLALFFGVCVFILCGFEHCVANMYYFTMGGAWSGRAVLYLLVMTVGNAAGGVIGPLARKVLSR